MEVKAKQHLLFDSEEGEVTALTLKPLPAACQPDAPFEDKIQLAIESIIEQFVAGRHLAVGTSYGKGFLSNQCDCLPGNIRG